MMKDISNLVCPFANNCLNDNECRHCGYGKMLYKAYKQGKLDERTKAIDECKDLIIALYNECETTTELCARFRDEAEQLKGAENE